MPSPATTTFLFTDIAGSTRLWAEYRDAMSAALARHDALLRAAVEEQGGAVFKTVGDAVCAAFPGPLGALSAAIAGQRALVAEAWDGVPPLTVRMAVHTGVAEPRDGDWFGQPLNRVARLLAIGHGGQVLVSRATEALVADHLTEGVALRDLGEHRLKDLARPERVFQLTAPGLAADFPALRSLDRVPGNLPVQLTSFVGRGVAVAEVRRLLAEQRLVTLTGVGGTGKTRLALQVAAEIADTYPDGAWFVDLAPVVGEDGVPAAVIQARGVRDDPGRPAEAVLAEHLRTRRTLVVLDNCEHVVAACARLVAGLLQACPELTVLATSREPLAIDGETLSPVPPLGTPAPTDRPASAEELARFAQHEAVRLFVDRAGAVVPGFAVTAASAPAIAQVCHRLDGIPLAIELAAARVKALSVEQIAARLDDRLRLLAGGGRDRLPRQQTLRAAIDWSYDLLPDGDRRVLERLSVFAGAVPLELIEPVCAGDGVEDFEVLGALIALVDKSLVVPLERGDEIWYRLLDTIQLYASEKLAASGADLATRQRHLGWYLQVGDKVTILRMGTDADVWLTRLAPLAADLQSATRVALAVRELEPQALDVFDQLWWYWYATATREVHDLTMVTAAGLAPDALREQHPMLALIVADHLSQRGRFDEAVHLAKMAIHGFQRHGNSRYEAWAWQVIGSAALCLGRLGEAESVYTEAVRLKRTVGDAVDLAAAVSGLGVVYRYQEEYEASAAAQEEALGLLTPQERGSHIGLAIEANLAPLRLRMHQVDAAAVGFLAALRERTASWVRPLALAGLAAVAATRHETLSAATLMGAAEAVLNARAIEGLVLEPIDQADFDRHVAAVRALPQDPAWSAAYAAGRAMTEEEAVAFALAGHGELAEPATFGEGEPR